MNKNVLTINESQLSNAIMSVLREWYGRGKENFLSNGESDGYDDSRYGNGTVTIEAYDLDEYIEDALGFDESDTFVQELSNYNMWPVKIVVNFNGTEGMKGDGYLTPDDPDKYEITDWNIVGENEIQDEGLRNTLKQIVETYMSDFDIEDYLSSNNMI